MDEWDMNPDEMMEHYYEKGYETAMKELLSGEKTIYCSQCDDFMKVDVICNVCESKFE